MSQSRQDTNSGDCSDRSVDGAVTLSYRYQRFSSWLARYELPVLLGIFVIYGLIAFPFHGPYQTGLDTPSYTDPAVSYLRGYGFTSAFWYAQESNVFWAGNVPLHQFLLLPWLKIFGISLESVLALSFGYILLGTFLVWLTLKRSSLIETADWRLGTIIFFLLTDTVYHLLSAARSEPLAFFLVGATAFSFTLKRGTIRYAMLFLLGALTIWAHLAVALYTAVLGALLLVFYGRYYWKEVLSFGSGGFAGLLGLLGMYYHFGVLEDFIGSVAPHIGGKGFQASASLAGHPLSGLGQSFDLPYFAVALVLLLIVGIRTQKLRFPLFSLTAAIAIPVALIKLGVFPFYYGWMLIVLLTILIFSMLSKLPHKSVLPLLLISLLIFKVVSPGSFPRRAAKNRLALNGHPNREIDDFVKNHIRPDDFVLLSHPFYFATINTALRTANLPKLGPTFVSEKQLAIVRKNHAPATVIIAPKTIVADIVKATDGHWSPTNEEITVWGTTFTLYRRSPQSQSSPQ